MYVKTLTLKGFKSFASSTTMRLEPGITCIVGPNGSGKSNVVDALAWVMGEQGAKSLRGGKMEDVIFAGTAGRPPLGRAEVSLTIDNADGALPIDYSEVTITRTMFRNGGSEYALNGTTCRLLDVQELLSDSGIGREMHVIVGQGQLDAVLRATPEERRGFIEEAAGVLKHRKRKEKALRKLETMEANLTRVQDLTAEIRRQLGPLGRQAETARRAVVIQADARDARLRLLADDLAQLTATLEQEAADESALVARRAAIEETVLGLRDRLTETEAAAMRAAPELAGVQERWLRFRSLVDKLETTASVAAERVRVLAEDTAEETTTGRDPEELRSQAAQARAQEQALLAEAADAKAALEAAVAARVAAEEAYAVEQRRVAELVRVAADRREGLARLTGQVTARQSRIDTRAAEIARLESAVEAARARAAEAEQEFAALESTVAVDEEGEEGLDAAYEAAATALERAESAVAALEEQERAAERDRTTAQARLDALRISLRRKDGAAALIERADEGSGLLGAVATLIKVDGGHEAAVAAALGWAAEAVAVDSADAARRAVGSLRDADAGTAGLLVPATAPAVDRGAWPILPDGARWAVDLVDADTTVAPAVTALLERVAVVRTPGEAAELAGRGDGVTAVSAEGDVFGPGFARGGGGGGDSLIELQSAADDAEAAWADAGRRSDQARFALVPAREVVAAASRDVDAALEELHASDARMAAVAERLGTLGAAARAA
ncbi:chromosome segregation SMC family protein, partial [Nostocoides japonicum]|uniref:chromosome segregation SMC family protein n=1 Tax=Nostocoides japonicum TaxID=99481 RepID=UPI00065BC669